jgi:hypothetical protein
VKVMQTSSIFELSLSSLKHLLIHSLTLIAIQLVLERKTVRKGSVYQLRDISVSVKRYQHIGQEISAYQLRGNQHISQGINCISVKG